MKFEKINDIMLSVVILFNLADIVCRIRKRVTMNQGLILDRLTNNIIDYTIKTREKVYNNVREDMVNYYWNDGRMIVEEEQGGDITPEYGRKLYLELAKRLQSKWGKVIHVLIYST